MKEFAPSQKEALKFLNFPVHKMYLQNRVRLCIFFLMLLSLWSGEMVCLFIDIN
jgi:hypothetical protein